MSNEVNDYLRFKVEKGWKEKNIPTTQEYLDRREHELRVIEKMGFPEYFLIVADFIEWAKRGGIPVGPGRGCFCHNNRVKVNYMFYKDIQDVEPSDLVQCEDGEWRPVEQVYEYLCNETVVDIMTESGSSIKGATKDHKIQCVRKEDHEKGNLTPQWVEADTIREGDFLVEHE